MALNDADGLRLFRLRVRAELLEKMVSQVYQGLMATPANQVLKPIVRRALLLALEKHAESVDENLLRHPEPEFSALDNEDRVLLTEEFRDVVSELKTFVEGLTSGYQKTT